MACASNEKVDIIFASLPGYLDFLAWIFKKIGYNVFCLNLSGPGQTAETERQSAVVLRGADIHNAERLLADAFDYSLARIMCFNYQELLARVKIILSGNPHAMTPDYEYLKRVVYGGLGDGKVQERIHAHVESLLSECQ